MFLLKSAPKRILNNDLVVAVDIGSSKIAGAVFKAHAQKKLTCLATAQQSSQGVKRGMITNATALEKSLSSLIYTLEQASKRNIKSLYLSVPGNILKSTISISRLNLTHKPIDNSVIHQAICFDKKQIINDDEEILHAIPISYQLDSIKNIKDPRKMIGSYLETTVHIITAPKIILRNLKYLLARCDLELNGLMSSPYAAGISTLTSDEMSTGATVLDIGAESTKISCFFDGNLTYTDHIPLGGMAITNDIAHGMNIPFQQAEHIKIYEGFVSQDYKIALPFNKSDRADFLQHIIFARTEELACKIISKFKSSKIEPLWWNKIRLTGGSAQLSGLAPYLSFFLQKDVEFRQPQETDATFSVCIGLIQCGYYDFLNSNQGRFVRKTKGLWHMVKDWFNED